MIVFVAVTAAGSARQPANVTGRVHYVAPNGSDTNPGTQALPWATLKKAATSVEPGDTVRIQAGNYYEPSGWAVSRAGTKDKPITYQAHGDGEVRITPSWELPSGAWTHVKGGIHATQISRRPVYLFQNGYSIQRPSDEAKIHSVDDLFPNSFFIGGTTLYVWLEDGSDPNKSVMRATAAHVVQLDNCHYNIFDGLTLEYGYNGFKTASTTQRVIYRNCIIRSIGSQGIQPVARDSVIERNLFQKIGTTRLAHGVYNSKPGLIVRYNVFEEITGAAIHQYHNTSAGGHPAAGNCQFHGNIFRKPRKHTRRAVSASSISYSADIVAWGEGKNLIYNNIFYGEGKRGAISLNSADNRIYHNTFVGSAYGVAFYAGQPGNQVKNNLVQDASRSFLIWPANSLPQTLDYNLYYNASASTQWQRDGVTYQTFSAYRHASGQDAHSRYENARLVGASDARLQPGSPAINAGTVISGVDTDFDGVSRPQGAAYDIGAFEARSR